MIVVEKGCPYRRLLEAWYTARGEAPQQVIELASYHAMIACVVAGMGAALLPKSVLETFPESDRLACLALPGGMHHLKSLYIWRRQAVSPNVTAFAEVLHPTAPARGIPAARPERGARQGCRKTLEFIRRGDYADRRHRETA
jgi:DNA-binding transcriptional LysR family regulator